MNNIIYLLGTGRSGSTLLDVALASHSRISSVGELMGLYESLQSDPPCADGYALTESPYWRGVVAVARGQPTSERRYFNGIRCPFAARRWAPAFYRKVVGAFKRSNQVIWKLMPQPNGVDFMIDSSKVYWRLQFLKEVIPADRLFVIFLVRDGKSVVDSEVEKGRTFLRGTFKWWLHNRGALTVIEGLSREQLMVVRFEDLIEQPERIIGDICRLLGISFEEAMVRPSWNNHFGFSGNRKVRAALREPGGLTIDRTRKRDIRFRAAQKLVFRLIAGRVYRELGYGDVAKEERLGTIASTHP